VRNRDNSQEERCLGLSRRSHLQGYKLHCHRQLRGMTAPLQAMILSQCPPLALSVRFLTGAGRALEPCTKWAQFLQKLSQAGCQWLTPVILAACEAESQRIEAPGQLKLKKSSKDPISTNSWAQWHAPVPVMARSVK
jgi:hypothetical protein